MSLGPLRVLRPSSGGALDDANGRPGDEYFARLAKLIPGETLATYMAGHSMIAGMVAGSELTIALWSWACLAACVLLRLHLTRDKNRQAQWIAVLISCIAFVLWVSASGYYGWVVKEMTDDGKVIATLIMYLFMLLSPLFYEGDEAFTDPAS